MPPGASRLSPAATRFASETTCTAMIFPQPSHSLNIGHSYVAVKAGMSHSSRDRHHVISGRGLSPIPGIRSNIKSRLSAAFYMENTGFAFRVGASCASLQAACMPRPASLRGVRYNAHQFALSAARYSGSNPEFSPIKRAAFRRLFMWRIPDSNR